MPLDIAHNVRQLTGKQELDQQILVHTFSTCYDIYGTNDDQGPLFCHLIHNYFAHLMYMFDMHVKLNQCKSKNKMCILSM